MLKTRILTAFILALAFIPSLFWLPNHGWALVILAISLLGLWEWGSLVGFKVNFRVAYVCTAGLLAGYLLYFANQRGGHAVFADALPLFALMTIFWSLLVPLWLMMKWRCNSLLMGVLGLVLLGGFWCSSVFLQAANPGLLLALLCAIWISDSAAYFTGKRFGKHKLAPSISPGKTWEGVLGAFFAVTIYAIALYQIVGVVVAVFPVLWAITAYGILGDLFESLLKRQANIKDSSNILPGHGGILDRIDALIAALPTSVFLIYLVLFSQGI